MKARRNKTKQSSLEVLSPEEAARRLKKDPSSVFLPIGEFKREFGLSEEEMYSELRSGRLVVCGTPVPGGFKDVSVSFDEVIKWILARASEPARRVFRERMGDA